MAIYVDDGRRPFGRMIMCHMLGDTVAELHAFAASIGSDRAWFQPLSRPHYDLPLFRRRMALEAGAIDVDRRGLVDVMRRRAPFWATEYEAARALGLPHP